MKSQRLSSSHNSAAVNQPSWINTEALGKNNSLHIQSVAAKALNQYLDPQIKHVTPSLKERVTSWGKILSYCLLIPWAIAKIGQWKCRMNEKERMQELVDWATQSEEEAQTVGRNLPAFDEISPSNRKILYTALLKTSSNPELQTHVLTNCLIHVTRAISLITPKDTEFPQAIEKELEVLY